MIARCIRVLGSRHLHLPRTRPTTCPLLTRSDRTRASSSNAFKHAVSEAVTSLEDRRLLGRARLHGIHSLDRLRFEADLGHGSDIGSRLLDRPDKRQDLDLWLFILDVNRQYYGFEGIKTTWRGLIVRGPVVELDSYNANARDLMDAFIYAGITENLSFLREVVHHSLRRSYFVTDLFVAVIGGLLRYRPQQASGMVSALMNDRCFKGHEDLLQVFRMACESTEPAALKHFCGILDQVPETDLYHDTIPYLWEQNRPGDAFALHNYLIGRRDRPKAVELLVPFVGYLAYSGQPLKPFLVALRAAGLNGYRGRICRVYDREVRRLQQNVDGEIKFDAKAVDAGERSRLRDHTIARILATSTFSFDFLITAISAFGTVELGPLAVRQMVLSSPDLSTLDARFTRLHDLDIDTGSSVFVIIVARLRLSRNWELLRLIAESDMHHDEFADTDLQRRLLNQYLARGSSRDLTRTLVILNEGHTDHAAQEHSLNLLLRSAAINHDWRRVLDIVTSLHQTDFRIKRTILAQLTEMLLPMAYSKHGFRPTFQGIAPFDVAYFLVSLLQQLLATRTNVSPSHWRLPLVRLARNRLHKVHDLSLFLADYYTSHRRNLNTNNDLQKLFTPKFQRALIAWDFIVRKWKHELLPNSSNPRRLVSSTLDKDSPARSAFENSFFPSDERDPITSIGKEPWMCGAQLLKRLRDEYGVSISIPDLEQEYLIRLQRMAHARGSIQIASNKNVAKAYRYTYRDFVEHWESLWYPTAEQRQQDRGAVIDSSGQAGTTPRQDESNDSTVQLQSLRKGEDTDSDDNTVHQQGRGKLRAKMTNFLLKLRAGEYAERRQRHARRRALRTRASRDAAPRC